MPIATTTIGAYPKPGYVNLPDWFELGPDTPDPTHGWAEAMAALGEGAEAILQRGTREAVQDQVDAGIDVPTEGEIPRENYVHYHCRHLPGVDFNRLTEKSLRNGSYQARLPTIVAPIEQRRPYLADDWRRAQACTSRPVKITLPGPMTIADTVVDAHYHEPKRLGEVLADGINTEVLALADAGCQHIQIDEPVFARKPDAALDYGLDHLERAFHKCPASVTRTAHMCCGYPDRLDNPDYPKADPNAYFQLAEAIEYSSLMAVSIEDAHRHNDLALLERFNKTSVILGVVAVAKSRLETVEEIRQRLLHALQHIDRARLLAAPDCGLGLLGRERAKAKLTHLCQAASSL